VTEIQLVQPKHDVPARPNLWKIQNEQCASGVSRAKMNWHHELSLLENEFQNIHTSFILQMPS
jgi:hypothetical protein